MDIEKQIESIFDEIEKDIEFKYVGAKQKRVGPARDYRDFNRVKVNVLTKIKTYLTESIYSIIKMFILKDIIEDADKYDDLQEYKRYLSRLYNNNKKLVMTYYSLDKIDDIKNIKLKWCWKNVNYIDMEILSMALFITILLKTCLWFGIIILAVALLNLLLQSGNYFALKNQILKKELEYKQ